MPEEKPLYASLERGIAVPRFGAFCKGFRGTVVQELYVREDGTGLYLKAGGRSADLVYKPNSFNGALLGKKDFNYRQLNIFPKGKEAEAGHLTAEELIDTDIAAEYPNIIRSMVNILYEGKEIEEAIIEPRRGIAINMLGFRVPEDTPFFEPSPITIRFKDDSAAFFMEPNTLLRIVCEDAETKTVYIPKQADN